MAEVRIEYTPDKGLEPDDPQLGLGFWSMRSGEAEFPDEGKGPLLSVDDEAEDDRGGAGRYYRRPFTEEEFNELGHLLRVGLTISIKGYNNITSSFLDSMPQCITLPPTQLVKDMNIWPKLTSYVHSAISATTIYQKNFIYPSRHLTQNRRNGCHLVEGAN